MPEPPSGRTSERFFLAMPADLFEVARARQLMKEVGRAAGLSDERIFDLQVVVSEACANAIEHAASEVEVEAWLLPDRVIVEITNDGAFQPGIYKDDEHRRRGLGLPLMVSLADQVHLSRLAAGKTQVSLTFFLEGGSEPRAAGLSLGSSSAKPGSSAENPPPGPVGRWVWLAIPLLLVAVAVLYVVGVNSSRESPTLLATFNTLFLTAALLIMSFLATRTYRLGGSRALWPLGWGASILGLSYLLGGLLITRPNAAVTISNVGIFVAGACMALSASWALGGMQSRAEPAPGMWKLTLPYLGVIVLMGLLIATTLTGVMPEFFAKGRGYTWWRDVVLGLGVVELLGAAVCFRVLYRREPTRFLLWCFSGLSLIGVALGGNLVTRAVPGTPLAWLTRAGGWLGGVLLLVAVFSVERGSGPWILPLRRALRETENRYKNLVDLSPDAIMVIADGRCVFANPAATRLFGASSAGELVGRDVTEHLHPNDYELLAERLDHALAGGVTPPREIRLLRRDGTPVVAEITASRVEFGGHLATQVVMRDITENKRKERVLRESEERIRVERGQAEAELKRILEEQQRLAGALAVANEELHSQNEELRRSRYNRSLMEAALDPLVTIGPDGKITDVNEATIKITGRARGELIGTDFSDYFTDTESARRGYREVFAKGSVTDYPLTVRGRDGKLTDVLYNAAVYTDQQGNVLGVFAAARDISELRELEVQRNIASKLQLALLDAPQQMSGIRFSHLYRSATSEASVGGDFYDVFEVKDGRIALLIGDVSGHGVEAARIAIMVKDIIHAFAHQSRRPSVVLEGTNELLVEKRIPGFVTLFLGILDRDSGVMTYCSAGHPNALLRTTGGVSVLEAASSPLGVFPDGSWKENEVRLSGEGILLLYTDGAIEARRDGEFFGQEGLVRLLAGWSAPSLEPLPQAILDEVLAFSNGVLTDDVALLAIGLGEEGASEGGETRRM